MIIKEITIENFRSYYGVNTIKFNDGLMLFIGGNGDGKTTFFEALEWLFDTSKQNIDTRLISKKKISELMDFDEGRLRVSMIFDHDGEKIIEKSFTFSKESNNIKTDNFQFKGFENNGSERELIQGGLLLDRCFEAAIRKYSLFKGENNLNVFNNPDALKYLIETFSNVREFDSFYNDKEDQSSFTDFAENQSQKAFEKAMRSDKNNSQLERELSSKIEILRQKLSTIKQTLKTKRENISIYTNKLEELENSKEASELLKSINERIKSLSDKKISESTKINEDYSISLLDEQWILAGFTPIFEEYQNKISEFSKEKRKLEREEAKQIGKQELAKEIANGIIPLSPNIPDKISMQEMINDEFCKVCGREAKEGSDAYIFMVNKLNDLIKSQQSSQKEEEKKLFPNNFSKELEQKSNTLEYSLGEINDIHNVIRNAIEYNEERKKNVKEYQQKIEKEEENKRKLLAQNDSFTEDQMLNALENITQWMRDSTEDSAKIALLENEEKNLEEQLEKCKEEYNKLAKDSTANTFQMIHSAFDKIKKAFQNAKDKNTKDFLLQLEDKANEYLKKLNIGNFYGTIRIVTLADGSAKIALLDKDNEMVDFANEALKTTKFMAVLFAVSDLTSLKRENDYPLIFDAPSSSFELKKEVDFFNLIAKINKQCIIFTKSFLDKDEKLDMERISTLDCTIYSLKKVQPFDEEDLSTIQTKVTLIK